MRYYNFKRRNCVGGGKMKEKEILQQYLEKLSEYSKSSDFDFKLANVIAKSMVKLYLAIKEPNQYENC